MQSLLFYFIFQLSIRIRREDYFILNLPLEAFFGRGGGCELVVIRNIPLAILTFEINYPDY